MKLDSILTYLRKNKFIVAFIIILFIIFFNLSIFHITNSSEGFTTDTPIGYYDYLDPIIPKDFAKNTSESEQLNFLNNFWSDDTWKGFISKWNSNNCPSGTGDGCLKYPPEKLKSGGGPTIMNTIGTPLWWQISEPEAQFYAQNGYFPYNGFIMNYITENPDIFTNANAAKDMSGNIFTLDKVKQRISNRLFYNLFIMKRLPNIKNDSSDPLSLQIIQGRAKPPSSSLASKAPTPPTPSPVSSLFSAPSTSSSTSSSPVSSLFSTPSTSSSTSSSPVSSLFSLPS